MKEYKYTINGNVYNVVIGDIEDNIAHVEVNGTRYNVEMEKKAKATAPIARPRPAAAAASVKPAKPAASKGGVKSPLPGVILDIKVKVDEVRNILVLFEVEHVLGVHGTTIPPLEIICLHYLYHLIGCITHGVEGCNNCTH